MGRGPNRYKPRHSVGATRTKSVDALPKYVSDPEHEPLAASARMMVSQRLMVAKSPKGGLSDHNDIMQQGY
jgi:hypothetical protein